MSTLEAIIFKLKNREITLSDFEKWIYSEKSLEKLIPPDDYLELISLNYKTPANLYEAEKILFNLVDEGKYYEWSLRHILEEIINKSNNSALYIEQCYNLYCEGYDFLNDLGLGYGLCISSPPNSYSSENWEQLENKEQRKLVESLYPSVADEAKRVLNWLDLNKIKITGHDGTYQGIQYSDNRTPSEKKSTIFIAIEPWWKIWS